MAQKLAFPERTQTEAETLFISAQEIAALPDSGIKSGTFVVQSANYPAGFALWQAQKAASVDGIVAYDIAKAALIEGGNGFARVRGGIVFRDVLEEANNVDILRAASSANPVIPQNFRTLLEKQGFTVVSHSTAATI